ncbi:MAG: glycerophosphodiester phosphodiesterase [Candidatus Sigynarchaeum springense]
MHGLSGGVSVRRLVPENYFFSKDGSRCMNRALENHEFTIDSHRGAFKGGLLENSIPAFEEALKEDANMLECDIRGTRDGNIALVHNKTIDHITKHATSIPPESEFHELPVGKVNDHTMSFLKAIKFEHGASILSLDEFLAFLHDHHVGAQIELKEFHFNARIVEAAKQADIDHETLKAPVVFSSFNPFAVISLRKAFVRAGLPLYDHFAGKKGYGFALQAIPLGSFAGKWVLRRCKKHKIWGFTTHYKYLPASRIGYAHECGVKFCPRIPDDEQLAIDYINADVDGFETDNVPFIKRCIVKAGYSFP